MAILHIDNGGTNQPMASGTLLRPSVWGANSMALFSSCYNFASPPAGWNATLNLALWKQPAPDPSVLSGNYTQLDALNNNWATNMNMWGTDGTVAVVGNVTGQGGHFSAGVPYNLDLGAIPSCTVFCSVSNYTVINTGQCGVDPSPTITDSDGNHYSYFKAQTGAGTGDDPYECSYLFYSMNVPASADLTVHIEFGGSGPANLLIWGMTHLQDVPITPPIVFIQAVKSEIYLGGQSTVNWAVTDAVSQQLNGVSVAASGSMVVSPSTTTDYTIVATGFSAETASAVATVRVLSPDAAFSLQKVILSLKADRTPVRGKN